MGYIHHSSFFSQKPIAFGAMVRIKDGEIVKSDFYTLILIIAQMQWILRKKDE